MKLTFKEFNDKINDWYDKTRPASGKPRQHVRNSFYEMYFCGKQSKYMAVLCKECYLKDSEL